MVIAIAVAMGSKVVKSSKKNRSGEKGSDESVLGGNSSEDRSSVSAEEVIVCGYSLLNV